jgi:hypothetical protein
MPILSPVCCGRFRPGLSRIQPSNNEISQED